MEKHHKFSIWYLLLGSPAALPGRRTGDMVDFETSAKLI